MTAAPDLEIGDPETDASVRAVIANCLNPETPSSFFLYAGAGSGKTRSLKEALEDARDRHGDRLRRAGHRIAVITYTNAACDEIRSRVRADPLFEIATIHSFCWSQIATFHSDIQTWLQAELPKEIATLEAEQAKGRAGTKAALDRARGIEGRKKRLAWLATPRRFTYNPNGDNFGQASLSHAEVLKITADFIRVKPSMRAMLATRFPFLLIDESQDTSKHLIDAFFALEEAEQERFSLGLFGDTMQRIYADGKEGLGDDLPPRWKRPVKRMNHRCPRRIVRLANAIRAGVDDQKQLARTDSGKGMVRLFLAEANAADKPGLESRARTRMAELTQDSEWLDRGNAVKTLTLEHHMAASRLGFLDMFEALNKDTRLTTGVRSGDLAGVRLFSALVAPLVNAQRAGNKFAVMAQLRRHSPLMRPHVLQAAADAGDPLADVRKAIDALMALQLDRQETRFLDVLRCVAAHGLFSIPDSLNSFIGDDSVEVAQDEEEDGEGAAATGSLAAWRDFLETPYRQINAYAEYIADKGAFGTHQGVKGLEFERVLVVMDDSEARGFLFSYDKLFDAKPPTPADQKKRAEGGETGVDRTRRLLYVTCTRAERSLALMAYTGDPDKLESVAKARGWFSADEIERL